MQIKEPLSSVIFIHNYIQLDFHEEQLTLNNDVQYSFGAVEKVKTDAGFCDALVALIGHVVVNVSFGPGELIKLTFHSGEKLRLLPLSDGQAWPECWEFRGAQQQIVVGQN